MKDVFVSIRGRVLLNAESLNMTESVGNYSKHRRVPVVLREEEGSYSVYFVPAISGESIAHGLQQIISEKCKESNPPLPVCKLCGKGIFLKSSNAQIFKESFDLEASNQDVEKIIISKCTVEDIGGFLYAEKANVKRTSNFFTGYMIPTQEALKNVVIEPQLHSRYALGTKFVEDKGQMLYYVEVSSSVYTFSLDLDTRYVGKLTFNIENAGKPVISDDERERRILVLLDAVKALLIENGFGAKKTRFLPIVDWESMVIAASDKPWSVPSPITRNYVERARKKLEKVSYNTNLYVFEGGNFEAFVADTMDKIKLRVKGAT
ncbi:MAG: type I-A CRISPR-associated protein Cas7/Csa2 [Nitrososphaerota archaeon]|nr:type I-A CRISPR-associated protein Cas7/Csa2 [Aigarchaeota archaeon]MDW8077125.1 type I-A CRISPR-associated protein Cas7/Csa2 [Nitrososphaerota archaeon]